MRRGGLFFASRFDSAGALPSAHLCRRGRGRRSAAASLPIYGACPEVTGGGRSPQPARSHPVGPGSPLCIRTEPMVSAGCTPLHLLECEMEQVTGSTQL